MLQSQIAVPGRLPSALQAVTLGLCAGALFWVFYRVFTIKFPLNFISPTYATIPLFGIPLGLLWARRAPQVGGRVVAALGAAIVLFAISALAFKDKSVHYLLFGAYYDYPAPTSAWVTRGLLASVPLSIIPILVLTRRFATLPEHFRGLTTPLLLAGIGGGVLCAELLTPGLGAYAILVFCCALCALFLPNWRVAVPAAALAALAGVVMYHPLEAIFTWQLREYKRLETYWTHHYKWDWIGFDNGHCVGGVHNEIMVHYSCDSPDKLPLTHLKMAEVISNGGVKRERVASIGRSDGIIATAHKARNPNLQRFVAVENDEQIVHDMLSRYSQQQGNIFTSDPRIELVGGSERLWLERTQEKFDAIYLDGIGLMLEPFPFTVIQQENYLFSADAYRRIFDDLLTPDGVFIVDRGTTNNGESQDLAASLPSDVQVRTLYTKIPTYPLTGLPLVYMIASRNGAELDRITRELSKGNLYNQDIYDAAEARTRRLSDDRPMFQPGAIVMMYVVMAPFALLTVGFALWLLKRQTGSWTSRSTWREMLPGILFSIAAIWITANGARAFVGGTQLGFAYVCAALFGGVAIGLSLWHVLPSTNTRIVAMAGCAIAFALQLAWPFFPAAALLAALCGGLGLGALLGMSAPATPASPPGFEISLGILIGIYVFQAALPLAGFKLLAALIVGLIALSGIRPQAATIPSRAPMPAAG